MRTVIYSYISNRYVVMGLLLFTLAATFFQPAFPFFAGLGFALITLWSSDWRWDEFGIQMPHWGQTVLRAIAYSIILFIAVDFVLTPFIELVFGRIHYGHFDELRGNLQGTLLFMVLMWIVAAVGEEIVFRGYYLKRMSKSLGDTKKTWIIGAVISSSIFGLAHLYQGTSGVIQTGIIGLTLSYILYHNQKNLVLLMLTHGFYNTIGIFLIYLNSERIIVDYFLNQ
ncbi:MAG: CPBP family intramembrane metalloprotease [Bacteroidia bacterium]